MAVVIMVVVAAIAFSLIIVIINSVRSLTVVLDASKAYYAAETGLENSLFVINEERQAKGSLSVAVASSSSLASPLENNSSYEIKTVTSTDDSITFGLLDQLDVAEVNYLNPDDPSVSVVSSPATTTLTWTDSTDCATPAQVEVSVAQWQYGYWSATPDQVTKVISDTGSETVGMISNYLYRVRARTLNCALEEITISATENGPPVIPVPIYGEIAITSLGEAGRSQAALQARTTWQAPVYSLYDFALFSECDIIKTDPALLVNCP